MSSPSTEALRIRPTSAAENLIASAIVACAIAKCRGVAFKEAAEQQLRAVREAGRLLALIQRSDGGCPQKNSSRGLTSYQGALQRAGISRQTANVWRRVAGLPEAQFERFIADARHTLGPLTIAELLRRQEESESVAVKSTVKLKLSEADYRVFTQHVEVLGAAYFTQTPSDTVMLILEQAYAAWLASQTAPAQSAR